MIIQKPRGTNDIFGKTAKIWDELMFRFNYLRDSLGYEMLHTPIFENENLFIRSVGETSDIVNKEFYSFKDKSDRSLVLRPEATASVARAIVENKLYANQPLPLKFAYFGPMFRYERPQNGRSRQFHQFGLECIGNITAQLQAEVVNFAWLFLRSLGLKKWSLKINNLGSSTSRKLWIEALKKYFTPYKDQLTEDSQKRLANNPLRILDDKVDGEKEFVKKCPKLEQFLTEEEKNNFRSVTEALELLNIKFIIDPTLVRGLDYYSGLVFEFIYDSEVLKGQSTLIGGGCYNNLIAELGGPDLPAVGLAMGMERLVIAIEEQDLDVISSERKTLYFAPLSEQPAQLFGGVVFIARSYGWRTICNYLPQKISQHFKNASSYNADFVIIMGDKDLMAHEVTIKNQKTFIEEKVKLVDFNAWLEKNIKGGK